MEGLRQWFKTNEVIVYAMYGQVFFTLGIALAVQSMKHTRLELGKHLRWLAAFGFAHGLVEWGSVFIPIQATYLPANAITFLRVLQLLLMTASFIFLLHFGLRIALAEGPLRTETGLWSLTSMLVTMALAFGMPPTDKMDQWLVGVEIFVRYLIAVPGGIAAAIGIWKSMKSVESMGVPQVTRWLKISSISLGAYGVFNLITPQHHVLMAPWFNYKMVLDLFGVPVQMWRTVVGLAILYGMVRSLSLFQIETDRILAEARERKLLEAERELGCLNQIAISLGLARDPLTAMKGVLDQLLTLLHCTSAEIDIADEGPLGWRLAARSGELLIRPASTVPPLVRQVAETQRLVVRQVDHSWFGVGIPVPGSQGLLAIATIYRESPLRLSPQEERVMEGVGILLGVSLENSRLWAELQRRETDRTEWINRIITAQEDERRHIAHELHDQTIQTLVLFCRRMDMIESTTPALPAPIRDGLEQTRQQAEALIASLRDFAHALRPPALDDLGIDACLRQLLIDLANRTGIQWDKKINGTPHRLHRAVEIGLFRIAQEALHNIEHHAHATTVHAELDFGPDQTRLRIVDNGKGMAARIWQGGSAASGRLGLVGMQERASLLGGKLLIQSRLSHGTSITAIVPNEPPQSDTPLIGDILPANG